MSLEVRLLWCPFSRILLVSFLLGPMTYLVMGYGLIHGARYGFHPVEWDLNLTSKWFATPMVVMPLLRQCACLVRPVIIRAHRAHTLVRLVSSVLLRSQA